MSDVYVGRIYNGCRSIRTFCYKVRGSRKRTTSCANVFEFYDAIENCPCLLKDTINFAYCHIDRALSGRRFYTHNQPRFGRSFTRRSSSVQSVDSRAEDDVSRVTALLLVAAIRVGREEQLIVLLTVEQRM